MKNLFSILASVVLVSGFGATAHGQFDYTPGFEAGPQEEMSVFDTMEGDWDVQLYYPVRDESVEVGWSWQAWAMSEASIAPALAGVAMVERNLGFPVAEDAPGADGYRHWSYEIQYSYDVYRDIYRLSVLDNIWGLADTFEGDARPAVADFSNLNTGTHSLLGQDGTPQRALLRLSDREADRFVMEWWQIAEANLVEGGVEDQPWVPSVRMEYTRR